MLVLVCCGRAAFAEPVPATPLSPPICERIGYRNPLASSRVSDLGPLCLRDGKETPLEGRELYRALGRADLERRYEKKRASLRSLVIAGAILGGTAVGALALSAVFPQGGTCLTFASDGSCRRYEDSFSERLLVGTGTVLVIASAGLLAEGLLGDPHPVGAPELRDAIDQRNQESERGRPLSSVSPPPMAFLLAPLIGPTSGGLALAGTF